MNKGQVYYYIDTQTPNGEIRKAIYTNSQEDELIDYFADMYNTYEEAVRGRKKLEENIRW